MFTSWYHLKLNGKHCRKPHCHNGVVDHLGLCLVRPSSSPIFTAFSESLLRGKRAEANLVYSGVEEGRSKGKIESFQAKVCLAATWREVVKKSQSERKRERESGLAK
jgi:hypothetical protein